METKWTPGPWRVEPTFETDESDPQEIRTQRLILAGDRQYIAETISNHAHLIAAAPELYEALEQAVEALNSYSDVVDGSYGEPMPNTAMKAVLVCEAALRKARGEKDFYPR